MLIAVCCFVLSLSVLAYFPIPNATIPSPVPHPTIPSPVPRPKGLGKAEQSSRLWQVSQSPLGSLPHIELNLSSLLRNLLSFFATLLSLFCVPACMGAATCRCMLFVALIYLRTPFASFTKPTTHSSQTLSSVSGPSTLLRLSCNLPPVDEDSQNSGVIFASTTKLQLNTALCAPSQRCALWIY